MKAKVTEVPLKNVEHFENQYDDLKKKLENIDKLLSLKPEEKTYNDVNLFIKRRLQSLDKIGQEAIAIEYEVSQELVSNNEKDRILRVFQDIRDEISLLQEKAQQVL
jgi:virulence-associated protein VapD